MRSELSLAYWCWILLPMRECLTVLYWVWNQTTPHLTAIALKSKLADAAKEAPPRGTRTYYQKHSRQRHGTLVGPTPPYASSNEHALECVRVEGSAGCGGGK